MAGGTKDIRRQICERATNRRVSPARARLGAVIGAHMICITLVISLIATPATSLAQGKKKTPARAEKKTPKGEPTLADRVATAKAEVVVAANNYKASLQKLLEFQQNDLKALTETLEKRKALLAESIISKKEVDESEQAVLTAQGKVAGTEKELTETDNLIAEATGEAQLAKLGPSRPGSYQTTAALIRYNGPAHWVLSDSAKVGSFFASKFKHAMPISAYGQTAVHDHLGFDHRNSMDVAVNPDSTEGQALMGYLRSLGIPFIAFRYAVKGSATGAHIHVGYPSHRISK